MRARITEHENDRQPMSWRGTRVQVTTPGQHKTLYKNLVEACEVLDLSYNTLKMHTMPFTYTDENGYPMRFDRLQQDQWRTVEMPVCRDCTCNTGGVQ